MCALLRMGWSLPWYSLPPESSFCFVVVITKRGFQNRAGWHSRTSGSIDIREKWTNITSGTSFLIVSYVTRLHVGLVGFVSLETAAWVQLNRSNQEDSKTGRVDIPGHPVL
jgi:hypothetical protein